MVKIERVEGIRRRLLDWYADHQRRLPWRETGDPYRIWVSEVMLQQTQVTTVIPYYHRFLSRFSDLKSLADADLEEVLKLWEGLGYYSRARNLQRAAQIVRFELDGRIPADWEGFRRLPGVGDYIASAVLSIAHGLPYAVVDGNVKRVLARLFEVEAPVNRSSAKRIFTKLADALLDAGEPAAFNQAIMELGALVCRPKNPDCAGCPLGGDCRAYAGGTVAEYPKRDRRAPVPEHRIAVGVVMKNGLLLITRRKPEGLLGGLWVFPGGKLSSGQKGAAGCRRNVRKKTGLGVEVLDRIARVRHAYSHFKIILDAFACRYVDGDIALNGPVDHRWIRLEELEQYPLPRAVQKMLPELAEYIRLNEKG